MPVFFDIKEEEWFFTCVGEGSIQEGASVGPVVW